MASHSRVFPLLKSMTPHSTLRYLASKHFILFFLFIFVFCFLYDIFPKENVFESLESHFLASQTNGGMSSDIKIVHFTNYDPVFTFVLYKGYRAEKFGFIAVGIGVSDLRENRYISSCYFVSHKNDSVRFNGSVYVDYSYETHDRRYETVLARCYLPYESGADWGGGDVHLIMHTTDLVFYSEKKRTAPFEPPEPSTYPHQLTLCSSPIYGDLDPRLLYEWMEYYIYMGVDYFVMYDAGGVDGKVADVLNPYVKKGVIEMIDIRDAAAYDIWFFGQNMLINDCAYKMRFSTKWAMVMDFDEFWNTENSKVKLVEFMKDYDSNQFVSFGSQDWSINHCVENKEDEWQIEKMVYHHDNYTCLNTTLFPDDAACPTYFGHRKYVFDPRGSIIYKIHTVFYPLEKFVELNATVARFNHFRGIAVNDGDKCKVTIKRSQIAQAEVTDWEYSSKLAKFAKSIRLQKPLVSLIEAKL